MAVTIISSLRIGLVSGTGVSFSAPVVPALTTDNIYNADNPNETLTAMFDGLVTGPMTIGTIPKAIGTTELGNSQITDNGPDGITFGTPVLIGLIGDGSITDIAIKTPGTSITMGVDDGNEVYFGVGDGDVPVNFYVAHGVSLSLPIGGGIQITGKNFAELSTGAAGMIAYIRDSNTTVWGATITGGGTSNVIGFWNGIHWTVMAK